MIQTNRTLVCIAEGSEGSGRECRYCGRTWAPWETARALRNRTSRTAPPLQLGEEIGIRHKDPRSDRTGAGEQLTATPTDGPADPRPYLLSAPPVRPSTAPGPGAVSSPSHTARHFAENHGAHSLATSCKLARSAVTGSTACQSGKISRNESVWLGPGTAVPSSISWLSASAVKSFELDAREKSVWRQSGRAASTASAFAGCGVQGRRVRVLLHRPLGHSRRG